MESYKRFNDPNYKHWLQTAESLCILRSDIRQFVETETEAYHQSLREKLKDHTCKSKCILPKGKKFPERMCQICERWKEAILSNCNMKGAEMLWNNCQPHLWPTNKWEVAKPFMIRGVKNHHSFDQFDISSILNFMNRCKYFKDFIEGQSITKVINVRNKVMHSPDFSFSKEEMDNGLKYVLELAKILEKHEPGLKAVSEKIQQFKGSLEKWGEKVSQSPEYSNKESLKLLDREQHALKEKIEFLAQCYENGHGTELNEELQGVKNFVEQNKDLVESLGPQMVRLNEIQEKVNKHEQDIDKLNTRVNRLETVAPDPMFSGDVLKFKNHLLEEARTRNMPEPEFTEEREASGFRGFVNVSGHTFRGLQVCNKKINAHQEVAKIALEYMNSHPEWKEDTTTSLSSSASSSSIFYYGTVTVVLKNQEVVSDRCDHAEEACESAYTKLARQFGLMSHEAGNTFRTAVLKCFQSWNFPAPLERSVCQDDKTLCKLQLSGSFTFYDEDGSTKKKQAEQQAAKVALQNLSEILNCRSLDNAGDNWKGFLKERIDALGLQQPEYDYKNVCNRPDVEEVSTIDDSSQISMAKANSNNNSIQSKIGDSEVQERPTVHKALSVDRQETETLDSGPPDNSNQLSKMDSSGTIFYGIVTVFLNNQEVVSDGCVQKDEATESVYRKLACLFSLKSGAGKTKVLEHFQRCDFPPPVEHLHCEGDKFLCKLILSGSFRFSDKDGSTKKKLAEQQAAKVALQHLSGLINCSFEVEPGKNYKGLLKEYLEACGLKQPVYSFKTKRGDVTEELEGLNKSEDDSHSHTGTADKCQVTETLDSCPTVTSSHAPKMDSTEIIYYGIVTVILNNQEVISDGCVHQEEAIESSYRKLACQFGLMSYEGKRAVLEYFQRYNFPLPLENLSPAGKDNKFFCKLQLNGDFTFFDKDGSSKKKLAEQQAAKVALQHLSGLFNCSFKDEAGTNYKGFLKEQLDARHLKSPVYVCREKGRISEEMEASSTSGDNTHSSCLSARQPNNSFSQECVMKETQDEGLLDIPNTPPNMDNTAINTLLVLFHLRPPSVTIEHFKTESIFSCRVNINLEKFTFQNNNDYTSKKVAIRKTYSLLGNMLEISKTTLDENNATMLVKEHFSQKSLTLPKEVFEGNKCSLNDITYNLVYDGEGSSETEAQQDALHKALDMLALLFGFNSLPKCSTVEKTEQQINSLLKTKGQKDLICTPKHNLYKSSAKLLFKNYTMERKHQSKKKENINHLSKCILGLLAVNTDPNTLSLRNCLDDWFKQKNLKQPVFDNTEEAHGSKVTFSVHVSCSSPNCEESVKVAEEKLVEEFRKRLKCLTD